jgi:hypothetical protein
MNDQQGLKEEIKARYGKAALQSQQKERRSCCGAGSVLTDGQLDPITGNLYGDGQGRQYARRGGSGTAGCGNPTALAQIAMGRDKS